MRVSLITAALMTLAAGAAAAQDWSFAAGPNGCEALTSGAYAEGVVTLVPNEVRAMGVTCPLDMPLEMDTSEGWAVGITSTCKYDNGDSVFGTFTFMWQDKDTLSARFSKWDNQILLDPCN